MWFLKYYQSSFIISTSLLDRACNDEDYRVVEIVERAAEYLGHFVHPKSCCHLIIPTLEETLSVGHLKVFSAILKGSERCALVPLLKDIATFLQQSHICQNKKAIYQKQILSCCHSLILICKEVCYLIYIFIHAKFSYFLY